MQGDQQGLRLAAKHAHPVAWWTYSHPARMLLLGTGDLGNWLQVCLAAWPMRMRQCQQMPEDIGSRVLRCSKSGRQASLTPLWEHWWQRPSSRPCSETAGRHQQATPSLKVMLSHLT